jgi:hypothetical protein
VVQLTEVWVWGREVDESVDRTGSLWRRPSHADKRRAWRRELLGEEIVTVLRGGATEAEILEAVDRLPSLAARL